MNESDVEVNCMCTAGPNIISAHSPGHLLVRTYNEVTSTEEPQPITKYHRHYQIHPSVWEILDSQIQLSLCLLLHLTVISSFVF